MTFRWVQHNTTQQLRYTTLPGRKQVGVAKQAAGAAWPANAAWLGRHHRLLHYTRAAYWHRTRSWCLTLLPVPIGPPMQPFDPLSFVDALFPEGGAAAEGEAA